MSVPRILDANFNRAREGLRVMEEAARFILEDQPLAFACKDMRHDLAHARKARPWLIAERDIAGDPGTDCSLASEQDRPHAASVVRAAGCRLGEALRAIEEYAKIMDVDLAEEAKKLRYRGYEIEQQLNRAMGGGRDIAWRLCVIFSESGCRHHDWQDVARAIGEAEVDCVQLREKDVPAQDLIRKAEFLRAHLPETTALIMNDRVDVALAMGADGVHLGQDDLDPPQARRLAACHLLVGRSTSRLEEAEAAFRDGADYCGVGPMYPSTTRERRTIAGIPYLQSFLAWGRLPHLAIGGITLERLDALIDVGVQGVAVGDAICGARDPAAAVTAFQDRLLEARRAPGREVERVP